MKGVHHSCLSYNVFKALIHMRYRSPKSIPPQYPPDIPVDIKKTDSKLLKQRDVMIFVRSNFTRNQTMGITNDFMWKKYF